MHIKEKKIKKYTYLYLYKYMGQGKEKFIKYLGRKDKFTKKQLEKITKGD